MFGIVYGLFNLFSSGYEKLRRCKLNSEAKKRGYKRINQGQNPYHIYFDWQGRTRDLYNNEPVQFYHKGSHYFRKGIFSNEIIDITKKDFEDKLVSEANKINGEIALAEYDKHRLWDMWQKKRNSNLNNNIKMPMSEDVLWDSMIIYRHCKSNKLCFKYFLGNTKFDWVKKDLEKIINKYVIGYKIVFPFAFIDIYTGKILDLIDDHENDRGKFGYKEIKNIDGKTNTHTEWLSREINDKIIEEYNKGITEKKYKKISSKWIEVFL